MQLFGWLFTWTGIIVVGLLLALYNNLDCFFPVT